MSLYLEPPLPHIYPKDIFHENVGFRFCALFMALGIGFIKLACKKEGTVVSIY